MRIEDRLTHYFAAIKVYQEFIKYPTWNHAKLYLFHVIKLWQHKLIPSNIFLGHISHVKNWLKNKNNTPNN